LKGDIIMGKKKIDKSEHVKIIQLRKDGYSIKEISNMFDVSSSCIGQILRYNGINTQNPRYLQFSYNDVLLMHNMYLSGISRIDIAKKYNICADSVYNLFLKYNFSVKSMSHAKRRYNINENYFDEINTSNKA
jgi:transposase